MRGPTRTRKKQVKESGWAIAEEGKQEGKGYYLVLRSPSGEQVRIEAATRPRAYRRAEVHTKAATATPLA